LYFVTVLSVFAKEVNEVGNPPTQPEVKPLATIYTHVSGGHMRAVLQPERAIPPARVQAAVTKVNRQMRNKGEKPLTFGFIGTVTVTLVDDTDTHTPSRLLAKAKSLATELGFRHQIVPPPR
jgi:hypothetical protein